MNLLLLAKVIAAIITVIIALVAGLIELRLNPKSWLNRWFFLFFISAAMGFFIYTIYHLITATDFYAAQDIIIPMMITDQILFNFAPICVVMTVFILEKYKKIALNIKHLGLMMVLLIIMSVGYFIVEPFPFLDWDAFHDVPPIIDTLSDKYLSAFVNILRIGLFIYVIVKYGMITKKVEEDTKKRIQWFIVGVTIITVGVVTNLIGGLLYNISIEIFALVLFDIGIFIVVKGFLI